MNPYQEQQNMFNMQSALQQQGIQGQQIMAAPYIQQQQQQVQATLVEQTNPVHIINVIEFNLRGWERKYDGSIVQVAEPIMNDMGIARIMFLLKSIVNQNTILSHLEDHEVARLIVRLGEDIIDDLTLNWRNYEIKDKILLDYIVDGVIFPAFMSLKRAWKQNEKNWLNKIVVESIQTSPRMQLPKKEGFFSRFKL